MVNTYKCPFCGVSVPNISSTFRTIDCFFDKNYGYSLKTKAHTNNDVFVIQMGHCPSCDKVFFIAKGEKGMEGKLTYIYPNSLAKQYPDYIPKAIREDYEEACSIVNLSPKASATLCRRCLQGMIRDFWKISKNTLYEEINELKDKIPVSQWSAIDSTRSIGNIGAHMEKDVNVIVDIEPNEAKQLIKLIELLIDKWYVARNDEQQLLKSINDIKQDKVSN